MLDERGYRPNVGIILINKQGQLLYGKRVQQDVWQFPQGGIKSHETPQQALFRELKEEVGLKPQHVRVLGRTQDWLYYNLPDYLQRKQQKPVCIGQKQIWFLIGFEAEDAHIQLNDHDTPEFDAWQWVDYWHPVQDVVAFKQLVYQQALTELEPLIARYWK